MTPSDADLLRAYAVHGDQRSFAQLVDRHGQWLTAAARRRLGDDHLADDATQAVFIVLAQKAERLVESGQTAIAAWLFHVMHLTCGRVQRTRTRQTRRERAAMAQRDEDPCGAVDERLLVVLEDAVYELPAGDREAVVRRFYEGAEYARIGPALEISAEAARKRVTRALAKIKEAMLGEGVDAIPEELLAWLGPGDKKKSERLPLSRANERAGAMAKGTMIMVQQVEAIDFAAMSAEFYVSDVEANLDFFEKLGFRRQWADAPDAMGRLPRASLRGGTSARIWLRRASESDGTRPIPGITLFYWINGGTEALAAHRKAIAAQGVEVSAFNDDVSLRNFTVKSPDGYSIGFFTSK